MNAPEIIALVAEIAAIWPGTSKPDTGVLEAWKKHLAPYEFRAASHAVTKLAREGRQFAPVLPDVLKILGDPPYPPQLQAITDGSTPSPLEFYSKTGSDQKARAYVRASRDFKHRLAEQMRAAGFKPEFRSRNSYSWVKA